MKRAVWTILLSCLSSSAFAQTGALTVVVKTPQGKTATIDQSQQIVATFNQPMVPLREVPEDESRGPLTISPPIAGKYRWMGTMTLAFIPDKPLPHATAFTVTIPAGTRSLSGQTLAEPVTWTFETPRPRVLYTTPYRGQKFVELDHSITITFNQPVDPGSVREFLSLEQRTGSDRSAPRFAVSRPEGPNVRMPERTILLTPDAPLKKSAQVTFRARSGLRGTEGALGMEQDHVVTYSTYNEFVCTGLGNPRGFPPNHSLQIQFSNPVSQREVARSIVFDPPVPVNPDAYYDYTYDVIHFSLPLKAETQYTMTILEGLKDRFGNDLTGQRVFTFQTGSFLPSVRMVTGQGILEAYESHNYPVTFTNIDSVTLQLARIPPAKIVEVMQRLDYSYYEKLAWEQAIREWVTTVGEDPSLFTVSRLWKPAIRRNEPTIRPVNLDEVLDTSRTGIVLLQVQNEFFPQEQRRYLKSLIQVTHMGITAKFSPDDNLIWVTSLRDASPVPGASVELRNDSNQVLWTGTTDRDGFVKSPGWGKLGLHHEEDDSYYDYRTAPRLWVIVRHNNDVAFSSSDWNNGIEPYTFRVPYEWNPKVEPAEGSVFTDRGLYKAGEDVHLKSVIRVRKDGVWRVPPPDLPVKVIVRNSRNEEILTEEPRLSPFGTFALSLTLKPDAPLGYYSVTVQTQQMRKGKQEWTHLTGGSFRVEAFRPAEFEVTARFLAGEYTIGDDVTGAVAGKYLFGGAMRGESVRWRLTAHQSSYDPPGYDGYFFGRLGFLSPYSRQYKILATGDDTLNNEGMAQIGGTLTVGDLEGAQSIQLEADVSSQSRQVISGRASVTAHGGLWYAGIKPASTFVKADSALAFSIITAAPDGKPVPEQTLALQVVKRYWRSVRVAETGGRYRWESTRVDTVLQRATVKTRPGPVRHTFIPPEPGFYFITATGEDSRGNTIATDAYFYASGRGYVAWERSNDDRIELIADKTHYRPGETAGIIVKSPYEKATALVSIEREGILRHYRTTLVGSAPQIDIPILNDYLPNVFVSVVLLHGRVDSAAITREADVGRPSFKMGYVNLGVSPREKLLDLTVSTARTDYRPGDSVEVRISARDQSGKGAVAEVALSVADLGVLNLTGYRLPRLFDHFYRQRRLAVTTSETRIHLIEQRSYDEKGEDEGGGGGEAMFSRVAEAEGTRGDFRPNAYWNPAILTDRNGTATVKFKLPDNLTSFEIMAAANTRESDFGYAEATFRVNKPLLLQPSLPRFARVGDQFEGGVVILNYTDKEKRVRLVTLAEGIAFTGRDTVVHVLKPGEAKEVRHRFNAAKTGTARFVFRATTDTDEDAVRWSIPIQVPRLRESVALYESLADDSVRQAVEIPDSVFADLGALEFTLASTGMVGLSGGISYLFEYPYGCLEQRLSSVLPMILAEDLVKAFRFEVLKDKDYRAVVSATLDEVPLFQRSDGGFSYWKNTDETWPYLSAYAMFTLVRAGSAGYEVRAQTLQNGFQYLRKALAREVRFHWNSPYYWDCTDALILYTLALSGKPEHGYMERLYGRRAVLPLFAKAYLLKALHAAGGYPAMVQELARDLGNMAKVSPTSAHFEERGGDGSSWCWPSNARTTALILQAFIETQPENSLIPKMVRWLVDQQKVGRWRTTQENLYVVDALATYLRVYEREDPAFTAEVKLAGGSLMSETFRGRSFETRSGSIPLSDLVQGTEYPIDVTKDGKGRLYYTIRMNYYPTSESRAKEEGFSIQKKIEPVESTLAEDGSFVAGSVARVTLTITTNQERNFVVVDDPVPAGFEIINTSFLTTGTNLEEQDPDDKGEWWWYNPFRHRELYDDRALYFADYLPANVYVLSYLVRATSYGTFAMPSTRIEGMYEPEVFGQTGSARIRIREH